MSFQFPRVTKFVYCGSLRFGAFFIGYFSMVSAIGGFILTFISLHRAALYLQQNKDKPPQNNSLEYIFNNTVRLDIIYGLLLFMNILYFIISLTLVIGVHKRKPRYLLYYYVACLIDLAMLLPMIIVSFVFVSFVSTVSHLISGVILFYFLLVVRSAFMEMEEQAGSRHEALEANATNTSARLHVALAKV